MSNGSKKLEASLRRRGRPAGKNRIPLSAEERRARNAQYERERRNEYSDAMAQLAEAAGCEESISNSDLLATVISQIQRAARRESSEDLENLRRLNENLESQIASLSNRLGDEPEEVVHAAKKIKSSPAPNSEHSPLSFPGKYPCTSSYTSAAVDQIEIVTGAKRNHDSMQSPEACPIIESSTDSHYPQSESTCGTQSEASQEIWTKDSSGTSSSLNYTDSENSSNSDKLEQNDYPPQLELRNNTDQWIEEARTSDGGKAQPQYCEQQSYEATYEISSLPVIQYNPPPVTTLEYSPTNLTQPFVPVPTETQITTEPDSMLDLFTDTEKGLIAQWLSTNEASEIYESEGYNASTSGVHWGAADYIQGYM